MIDIKQIKIKPLKYTIISLTEVGLILSKKLGTFLSAECLHRPKPFTDIIRERFQNGNRMILICAIGIAVRTIAPLLNDKYRDPAVLVLDEYGRFVVPILSGHEGGANDLARQISKYLGAQLVITGAQTYTNPILIAGLGCNRGCHLTEIQNLLSNTLSDYGLKCSDLNALSSIEVKQNELGLQELALLLQLPIYFYTATTLSMYTNQLSSKSSIVFQVTGCYGVAEAAALAHAEHIVDHCSSAELIIPKRSSHNATCAIARIYSSNH